MEDKELNKFIDVLYEFMKNVNQSETNTRPDNKLFDTVVLSMQDEVKGVILKHLNLLSTIGKMFFYIG